MTREEAIEQLNFMIETIPKEPSAECDSIKEWLDTDKDIRNALEMAINALEQESCKDAVSRQAVLNTLNRMDSVLDENRTVETYKELLIACYNDLPPVTPIKLSANFWTALEMAIKALEQESCEDVMAIHTQGLDEGIRCAMCTNSMKSDRGCDGGCVVDEDMYKKIMDTIKNHIVPPVTPTHKKGKWIRHEERKPLKYGYELVIKGKCSNCGEVYCETYRMKYCPNCGAEMEGEE